MKPLTGKASYYTLKSVKAEGNSGVTASGEKLNEAALTFAMRKRGFGKFYRLTNLDNGKSIMARHNDYGPGNLPASRGVIVDLTPAAYLMLGGSFQHGILKNVLIEPVMP